MRHGHPYHPCTMSRPASRSRRPFLFVAIVSLTFLDSGCAILQRIQQMAGGLMGGAPAGAAQQLPNAAGALGNNLNANLRPGQPGSSGASGTSGTSGTTGASGASGATLLPGLSGATGAATDTPPAWWGGGGATGTVGVTGPSGATGAATVSPPLGKGL